MLVCDVSAVDRLIDMFGENILVMYKSKSFQLYDLRDEFVDNNIECSIDNFLVTSQGIFKKSGEIFVELQSNQNNTKDDLTKI